MENKIEFLDTIQIDPDVFNQSRDKNLDHLEKNDKKAYQDIFRSDKHHPLKARKTRDFRLDEKQMSELLNDGITYKSIKKGSFAQQYLDIYNNDLPVIITSDSILYALHKFYDTFLKNLEETRLISELMDLCNLMLETLYTVAPTSDNVNHLRQLEVFFMVPLVILMHNNELRPDHVIRDSPALLFSIEECKTLLKKTDNNRNRQEFLSGYNITKHAAPKFREFVDLVYPNNQMSYRTVNDLYDTYLSSPKLNTAINTFCTADINKPLIFKFGGREEFENIIRNISNSSPIEFDFCGVTIKMDATQFKPRGHYTESLDLKKYFIAFTWLSKFVVSIDRKNEEKSDAITLSCLIAKIAEQNIDRVNAFQNFISQIVGESDGYNVQSFLNLVNQFIPKTSNLNETFDWILHNADTLSDCIFSTSQSTQLKRAKLTKFGDIINKEMTSIAFSLIGKGSQIDNTVIQRLVDDNITLDKDDNNMTLRKFPSAFDVLYAVFQNSSVKSDILRRMENVELQQRDGFKYSTHLANMKEFVDEHFLGENEHSVGEHSVGEHEPNTSLYSQELKMLRALVNPDKKMWLEKGMYPFNTNAWDRKQAQTQLGHYTELRHDNVLYVDEACGGCCECSHPDLIIEPVPTFWREMLELIKRMKTLVGPTLVQMNRREKTDIMVLNNFELILNKFMLYLDTQMNGQTNESLKNELTCIMNIQFQGSGATVYGGWYMSLFHCDENAFEQKPEVCSFFTGVVDERGPGGIVHIGTGYPQMMYVLSKNDCDSNNRGGRDDSDINGSAGKVFVGPTYQVYEVVTTADDRMNDDDWIKRYEQFTPIKF